MGDIVEWFGTDGEWHPAEVIGRWGDDDDRVAIVLDDGGLIVAHVDRLRGRVPSR